MLAFLFVNLAQSGVGGLRSVAAGEVMLDGELELDLRGWSLVAPPPLIWSVCG